MRYRDKTELQDRLAAEYVLGTLRGPARARFRRWVREDAALAQRVEAWQARLGPLALSVAARRPPARVWRAIAERAGELPGRPRGLWHSLAFWRALALAASGATAALLAAVSVFAPLPPPVVPPVATRESPAAYLAVLSDPQTHKPMLIVSAARRSNLLWVKALDPSIHVPNKSLELWAMMPKGQPPKSLGMLSREQKTMLPMPDVADRSLADLPMLAVSAEPMGGSPTGKPTGPVMYTGPCVQYW